MTNKIMILENFKKPIPLLMLMLFSAMSIQIKAQSARISPSPQQIMADIYKVYDSLNYLTFDLKYTYTSDTLNGDFTNDVLQGSYTMAGKKAKYNLGEIEFMQNDSF